MGTRSCCMRVAVAHGHAAVLRRVKVERHAIRRADLVLTAVALADGAGLVIVAHEALLQLVVELGRGLGELFRQRQHRALERRERRVEVHDDAGVVLGLVHDLLVIRLAQEGERHAVCAERRLDDIGDVVLVFLLIEIVHVLAGELLVLASGRSSCGRRRPRARPSRTGTDTQSRSWPWSRSTAPPSHGRAGGGSHRACSDP